MADERADDGADDAPVLPEDERGTSRLEAFSDGVMAVAITLLVLDVHVPAVQQNLGAALLGQWPIYLGYVTSFLLIGIYWANHHSLFRWIARTDSPFLMINTVFLMVLVFIPFATALLTHYLPDPENKHIAAFVYILVLTLTALLFYLVWLYASSGRRLLRADVDERVVRATTRAYLLGPLSNLAALLISLVNVEASLAFLILLAVFYSLPANFLRPRRH